MLSFFDACHPCLAGLDLESAEECMPRWYGVSSGNGNAGVSHSWPDYYVRCTPAEAYDVARAAMIDTFQPGEGMQWAADNTETEGEAEFVISATIYDPPEDESDDDSDGSWSEYNGAWSIVEVFPCGTPDTGAPQYNNAQAAFRAEALALAREE